MRSPLLLVLLLLLPSVARSAILEGTVIDAERKVPVQHAVVFVGGVARTETDAAGRFRLTDLLEGNATVRVEQVGYQVWTSQVHLSEAAPTVLAVSMASRVSTIAPMEVRAKRPDPSIIQNDRKFTSMQIREGKAGTIMTDPLRAVEALPGSAAAGDDFSNRYVVRGGDPEENLVMYDGYPLLQPVHLEGFTSVIYDDLIGDVDVYPGALPVRYGNALSSVTLLGPAKPDTTRKLFRYDLGSIALGAQYPGPQNTMIGAARTSFYNLIIRRPAGVKSRSFQDAAGRLSTGSGKLLTTLTAVGSRDRETAEVNLVDVDRAIDSYLLGGRVGTRPGAMSWHAGAYYTERKQTSKAASRRVSEAQGDLKRENLMGDLEWTSSPSLQGRFDVEGRRDSFDDTKQTHTANGGAGSAEGTWIGSWVSASLGGRVEKIPFTKGVPVSPYASFRLRTTHGITPGGAWRIVRQSPFVLDQDQTVAGLPVDTGSLLDKVNGRVSPSQADHLSGSCEADLGNGLTGAVELYYKRYSKLLIWPITPANGVQHLEKATNGGTGTGQGVELSLKREAEGVTGQVSFSLSRTRKRSGPAPSVVAADYDQPRMLQLQMQIPLADGTTLSFAYRAASGRPITPLKSNGIGDLYPDVTQINAERLPAYHRLDAKIEHKVSGPKNNAFLYLDVLNLSNHTNVVDVVQYVGYGGAVLRIDNRGVPIMPIAGFGFYF